MSKNNQIVLILVLLVLAFFLLRFRAKGSGKFSYVGYYIDENGNRIPYPLVEAPQPVMMPIPSELPY